jgi:hypothetical protein
MARTRKQSPDLAAPEAPRRARAAAIAIDAGQLARAAFARAGFVDPMLVLRWREIAGPEVAGIAQPIRISQSPSGTVLTLKADPAAAVFLQHESRALCARICACLGSGSVQRLRFVPGEITPQAAHAPQKNPQEIPVNDPTAKFAGHEGLKSALVALASVRRRT